MIQMYDLIAQHVGERQIRMTTIWGERIRLRRVQLGMKTQKALAEKAGVSQQVISRYEHGGAPQPELLVKIADALKTSIDYLLGRTNDPELLQLSANERALVDAYRRGDMDTVDDLFGKAVDDLLSNDPALHSPGLSG